MSDTSANDLEACDRCGQLVSTRVVFCTRCGKKLREPVNAPRLSREPFASPPQSVAPPALPSPPTHAPIPVLNYRGPQPPAPPTKPESKGVGAWGVVAIIVFIVIKVWTANERSNRLGGPPPRPPQPRVYLPPQSYQPGYPSNSQPSPYGVPSPQPSIPDPNAPRPIRGTSFSIDRRGQVIVNPPVAPAGAPDP